jgi:thioredoxin-dependent peroxiredoxin
MVKEGEKAPDFEAPIAGGGTLASSSLRGAPTVLYFYPQADTTGCTIEAKGFRDVYGDFRAKKVNVIGVSVDDVTEQEKFAGKYSLPFPLIADTSKQVSTLYGVLGPAGKARRVTFLIDPRGTVLEVVEGKAEEHVKRAQARFLTT